jgi:hypothetical protein
VHDAPDFIGRLAVGVRQRRLGAAIARDRRLRRPERERAAERQPRAERASTTVVSLDELRKTILLL